MSKFGFISGLDAGKEQQAQKQKFQVFEATLGFERVRAVIPFARVDDFISAATMARPRSVSTFKKLVEKFEGTIE